MLETVRSTLERLKKKSNCAFQCDYYYYYCYYYVMLSKEIVGVYKRTSQTEIHKGMQMSVCGGRERASVQRLTSGTLGKPGTSFLIG